MIREVYSFDWSGRDDHTERVPGIRCYRGRPGTAPVLQATPAPGAVNWNRAEVLTLLQDLARLATTDEGMIVAGMDFAFSFPFAAKGNVFLCGAANRAAFWNSVGICVWPNAHGTAEGYVVPHAAHFRRLEGVGTLFMPALRLTEQAAYGQLNPAGRPGPCSVFHLIGPNQVGKGSLCGISLMQRLLEYCLAQHLPLAIWPFLSLDTDGVVTPIAQNVGWAVPTKGLVVIETYPSFHWMQSGYQRNQWNTPAIWPLVAAHFGGVGTAPLPADQDGADALITWYAMAGTHPGLPQIAHWLGNPSVHYREANGAIVQQEGWIYGV